MYSFIPCQKKVYFAFISLSHSLRFFSMVLSSFQMPLHRKETVLNRAWCLMALACSNLIFPALGSLKPVCTSTHVFSPFHLLSHPSAISVRCVGWPLLLLLEAWSSRSLPDCLTDMAFATIFWTTNDMNCLDHSGAMISR